MKVSTTPAPDDTGNGADSGTSQADPRAQLPERVGQAARQVLDPIAQLFVAHGLSYAQAEALLKESFFAAGERELARAGIKSNVSRLSVSSGLNRKEIRRLAESVEAETESSERRYRPTRAPVSPACALYTRWLTDPAWRNRKQPDTLPLRADNNQPSFEQLAREISSDAHPRTLLEELRRLGLAVLSDDGQSVQMSSSGFVPMLEQTAMLDLLADNLSDHATTAVLNVIEPDNPHLEQAVFCENLSENSIQTLHQRAREIWAKTMKELVATMSGMEKRDKGDDDKNNQNKHRIRIGMYCYSDAPRSLTRCLRSYKQSHPGNAHRSG